MRPPEKQKTVLWGHDENKILKDIYQGVEGGDGEYTQSTHCQLCGATGKG